MLKTQGTYEIQWLDFQILHLKKEIHEKFEELFSKLVCREILFDHSHTKFLGVDLY